MPELMFVLKSFVLAIVITLFMQVKVGTATIEAQSEDWLRTSSVSLYLQSVSGGAVLAIKNATKTASDFVAKKFGHAGGQVEAQHASRLNFEFKRSKNSTTAEQGADADSGK